uniref:Secreted protein n=1 Tax=Oryza barthii TaxID=65489 RepID=A0A0D3GDG4_9ORYZ
MRSSPPTACDCRVAPWWLPLVIVVVQLSPSVRLPARWPHPSRLPIVALVERLPSASPSALDGCLHPRLNDVSLFWAINT